MNLVRNAPEYSPPRKRLYTPFLLYPSLTGLSEMTSTNTHPAFGVLPDALTATEIRPDYRMN